VSVGCVGGVVSFGGQKFPQLISSSPAGRK
jgi:hypothetical protein